MKKARQEAETLKTANRPKGRNASAVASLAGKALHLRVLAPLLFILTGYCAAGSGVLP